MVLSHKISWFLNSRKEQIQLDLPKVRKDGEWFSDFREYFLESNFTLQFYCWSNPRNTKGLFKNAVNFFWEFECLFCHIFTTLTKLLRPLKTWQNIRKAPKSNFLLDHSTTGFFILNSQLAPRKPAWSLSCFRINLTKISRTFIQ